MEILIKNDDDIRRAHERYRQFTHNDELRAQYRSRERWRRDRLSEIMSAKLEGIEETAVNLMKAHISDDIILQSTGLTPARLEELREDLKL